MDYDLEVTHYFLFLLNLCKDPADIFPHNSTACSLAKEWLEKLCTYKCESLSERRLRNVYLSHLCACLNEAKLRGPFVNNPGPGQLKPNVDFEETPSICNLNENAEQLKTSMTCDDREMLEECLLKVTSLNTDSSVNQSMFDKCELPRSKGYTTKNEKYKIEPEVPVKSAKKNEYSNFRAPSSGSDGICPEEKPTKRGNWEKYTSTYAVKAMRNRPIEEKASTKNDCDKCTWKPEFYAVNYEKNLYRWDQNSSVEFCGKQKENDIKKPLMGGKENSNSRECIKNRENPNSQACHVTTRSQVQNCSEEKSSKKNRREQYSSKACPFPKENKNDIKKPQTKYDENRERSNSCENLKPPKIETQSKERSSSCACPKPLTVEADCAEDMIPKTYDWEKCSSKPEPFARHPFTKQNENALRKHTTPRWDEFRSTPLSYAKQNKDDIRNPPTECAKSRGVSNSPTCHTTRRAEANCEEDMPSRDSLNIRVGHTTARWEQFRSKTLPFANENKDDIRNSPTGYAKNREVSNSTACHKTRRAEANCQDMPAKEIDCDQYSSKPDSFEKQLFKKKEWDQYTIKPESCAKQNENDLRNPPTEYANTRGVSNSPTCHTTRRAEPNCQEDMPPKKIDCDQYSLKPDSYAKQFFKKNEWDQYNQKTESCPKQNESDIRKAPTCYTTNRPEADSFEDICSKETNWDKYFSKPDGCAMEHKKTITCDSPKEMTAKKRLEQYCPKPETCTKQNENDIKRSQCKEKPVCNCDCTVENKNEENPECNYKNETPQFQRSLRPNSNIEKFKCSTAEDKYLSQSNGGDNNNCKIQPECIIAPECKNHEETENIKFRLARPYTELCEKYIRTNETYIPKATTVRQQVPITPQNKDTTDLETTEDCGKRVSLQPTNDSTHNVNFGNRSNDYIPAMQNENLTDQSKENTNPLGPFSIRNENYIASHSSFSRRPRNKKSQRRIPRTPEQNYNRNPPPPPVETEDYISNPQHNTTKRGVAFPNHPPHSKPRLRLRPSPRGLKQGLSPRISNQRLWRSPRTSNQRLWRSPRSSNQRLWRSPRSSNQRLTLSPRTSIHKLRLSPRTSNPRLRPSPRTSNQRILPPQIHTVRSATSKTSKVYFNHQSLPPSNVYDDQPCTSKQTTTTLIMGVEKVSKPPRKPGRGNAFARLGRECFCEFQHSSSELTTSEDELIAVESYECQAKKAQPQSTPCCIEPKVDPCLQTVKNIEPIDRCCLPQNVPKSDPNVVCSRKLKSETRFVPPTVTKSDDASLCPRKTLSFCPSKSAPDKELLRDDIYDLLDSIACELRGDAEPGCSSYLESELIRYKEFLTANTPEAACAIQQKQSSAKLRSFLLLRLQNDLVKLLTEECI